MHRFSFLGVLDNETTQAHAVIPRDRKTKRSAAGNTSDTSVAAAEMFFQAIAGNAARVFLRASAIRAKLNHSLSVADRMNERTNGARGFNSWASGTGWPGARCTFFISGNDI
jgi:hypothetical protein